MNLRTLRWAVLAYAAFDLLFGGICGGFLPLTPLAVAQFTTVSGTVTDPNGLPYANGTITAILITSASPTLNGFAYTPPTQPTGLSPAGTFVMQLADNTALLPANTRWSFNVCSAIGTVLPAGGTGPACFTVGPLTISGTSLSITPQLAAAIALTTPAVKPSLPQPQYPEGYIAYVPGTLYPATLTGTCVFAASTTCTVSYPATWSSVPIVTITPVNPGAITFTLTTSSTSQIIITASGSNSLTVNYSATLPAGTNCSVQTFSLAGARQSGDFVAPLWPSALPLNVDGLMRVAASDLIEVRLCNPTSSTISFGSTLTFGAKIFR